MRGSDVVGYAFNAEILCTPHTITAMRGAGIKVGVGGHGAIRSAAERLGLDLDKGEYDSGDFPARVLAHQCMTEFTEMPAAISKNGYRALQDRRCDAVGCGKWLVEEEKSPARVTLARLLWEKYEFPQPMAMAVAGALRELGLSHPEHVEEEDVQYVISTLPHDWRSVRFKARHDEPEFYYVPVAHEDECFDCNRLYDAHTVKCLECKQTVSVVEPHHHAVQVKGQLVLA